MKYKDFIKEEERKVSKANLEVNAVKWMFLNSDYYPGFTNLNKEIDKESMEAFDSLIMRFINEKEPPQYLINKAFFYGYEFYVDKRCFIPRNETEQLVEQTIYRIDDRFSKEKTLEIADVCTGSGIIGISLKKEVPNSNVIMCDISSDALEIVEINAKKLEADVKIVQGDFIEPIKNKKYDVIMCNPPYIKDDEILDTMVVDHEPNVALFGGSDGLKFYRIIFKELKNLLNDNGFIGFEIGYDLKEGLTKLIEEILPDLKYEFLQDYNNLDRMLFIYNESK